MRKLVTLRQIGALNPIPNADAIEVASVDGWNVVVKKGQFSVGDWVVYFEIDSVLPEGRPEFDFLMARGCKDHHCEDGTYLRGHRLRTIKLRGQVSQGLVIPVPVDWKVGPERIATPDYKTFEFDEDLSEIFGVKKYEAVIPACLAGQVRGNYPSWLAKTDQERIQNCFEIVKKSQYWQIEEKLEGSSMTIYWDGEQVGVTSRNLDLKLDQEGNTFVDVAKASGLLEGLKTMAELHPDLIQKIAIRGELIGPGIQDNIYGLKNHQFHIFDIWVNDGYLNPIHRDYALAELMALTSDSPWDEVIFSVPVIQHEAEFKPGVTVEDIVAMADGESRLAPTAREGLVFKGVDENGNVISFKAISAAYLLGEKQE